LHNPVMQTAPRPHISPDVDFKLRRLVAAARQYHAAAGSAKRAQQEHLELEVRMKVGASFFVRVLEWFKTHCSHQATSQLSDDVFYTHAGKTIRSSRRAVGGGGAERDMLVVSTVEKTRMGDEMVKVTPLDGWASGEEDTYCQNLRMTLNVERATEQSSSSSSSSSAAAAGEQCGAPLTLVRRKERHSFAFHKWWRLDATVVHTGKTLHDLEERQRAGECEYELEIECVNLPAMLAEKSDAYIAQDAMLKCAALFYPRIYQLECQ
jgi:hypothetical protein